jgi:hypothetical protein
MISDNYQKIKITKFKVVLDKFSLFEVTNYGLPH